jgi:hypothetical protein
MRVCKNRDKIGGGGQKFVCLWRQKTDLVLFLALHSVVKKSVVFAFFLLLLRFPVALLPNAGHGLLILEVYGSHTTTRHSR